MASPSLAYSSIRWKYDVFLSFRGEDTRKNFTDHLYAALDRNGIFTFRDDEELERGKEISSELLSVIEESMFSIIILSRNYVFSTWCLDELAKIVDCIKEKRHTAFPVFYDVDPSDVRKQTGEFEKAFDKHTDDFKDNKEKVERWRSALTLVANLSGWHLQERHESKFIQKIVNEISKKLDVAFPTNVAKDLVGIEPRVKVLIPHLRLLSNNVRFIGMCGMGGIGKTTLARVVYDSLSNKFDGSCFLRSVREVFEKGGIVCLQKQLLSEVLKRKDVNTFDVYKAIRNQMRRKRVLLVLDDVDRLGQLQELAGEPDWFGHGSRIIITTRDEQLLIAHGVQYRYKVSELDHAEATTLFYLNAFKHEKPTVEQFQLSKRVINYTQRLPLALVVVGSSLCDESDVTWKSTLDRLQIYPDKTISHALRISYDGLHDTEKQIFLDIACFFKGKDKDRVMEILDGCGFYPDAGVKALIQKSLLTILDNKFWMHDLVQIMGWEIVREKHRSEPGKWSRLWESKNIYHVLQENKGKEAVEGIVLDQPEGMKWLNGKSFSNMSNLRLLQISNFQLFGELEYLSNELRFLDWPGYPSKSFPSSFHAKNLFELNMRHCHIEYIWEGIKSFNKLKAIDLSHSSKLVRTPDFTEVPNLQRLNLEGCISLLVVDQSVGALERLTLLNLKNCKNLMSFPSRICGLKSLKILTLYGCSKLDKLPQDLGELKSLKVLDASETAVRQVPYSIVRLRNLERLSFYGCKEQSTQWIFTYFYRLMMQKGNLDSMQLILPPLKGLFTLKILDLGDCNLLEGGIPRDIGSLSSLEELNLRGNNFLSIPESIKELSKLKILRLDNCQRLQSLPKLPPNLSFLGAENCSSLHVKTLSRALKNCTSANIALHFSNGRKLVNGQGRGDSLGVELLNSWLEQGDLSNQASQFHIRVPGSEIPNFFIDWSNDSSITVTLPSRRLNQIKGFAVCFILEATGHQAETGCGLSIYSSQFSFKVLNSTTNIDSSHLCLSYISKRLFQISDSGIGDPPVSVRFYATDGYPSFVKKCGIFPVYNQFSIWRFTHCTPVTRVRRGTVKARIFS